MSDPKQRQLIYCQIVAQLIIADAVLTDEEHNFLVRLMDRFGFDDNDRKAVVNAVDIGQPIDDKLKLLDDESRRGLLDELVAVAMIDGDMAEGEAEIIATVRRAIESPGLPSA
jgi:uncharacterized tellurite resistance protein B-like protein